MALLHSARGCHTFLYNLSDVAEKERLDTLLVEISLSENHYEIRYSISQGFSLFGINDKTWYQDNFDSIAILRATFEDIEYRLNEVQ